MADGNLSVDMDVKQRLASTKAATSDTVAPRVACISSAEALAQSAGQKRKYVDPPNPSTATSGFQAVKKSGGVGEGTAKGNRADLDRFSQGRGMNDESRAEWVAKHEDDAAEFQSMQQSYKSEEVSEPAINNPRNLTQLARVESAEEDKNSLLRHIFKSAIPQHTEQTIRTLSTKLFQVLQSNVGLRANLLRLSRINDDELDWTTKRNEHLEKRIEKIAEVLAVALGNITALEEQNARLNTHVQELQVLRQERQESAANVVSKARYEVAVNHGELATAAAERYKAELEKLERKVAAVAKLLKEDSE